MSERLIFFDTETTGLSVDKGDRIVEIGAIECLSRHLSGKSFHTYLNPDRSSHPEALAVHQLTDEFLAGQPRFRDQAKNFLAFIGSATLVIHNADFDMRFINAELQKINLAPLKNPIIDTIKLARGTLQGLGKYSLDALCDHFRINRAHRVAHGALLDAQLLAEVYLLMTRAQRGLDINSFEHLRYDERLTPFRLPDGSLPIPTIALGAEQIANHRQMMGKFKSSLWQD